MALLCGLGVNALLIGDLSKIYLLCCRDTFYIVLANILHHFMKLC
jgi:hypothetical protein